MGLYASFRCHLPTGDGNARNTEGCFIRLKDGSILYAYSRYFNSSADDGASDIGCVRSHDEGESWSRPEILLARKERQNLMCPTLMWMENGDLGLFYLFRSNEGEDANVGKFLLVRSSDEGKSWSEPICITPPTHNVVVENGHVIRLKSGRILVPFATCADVDGKTEGNNCRTAFMLSDDDGRTWFEASRRVCGPSLEWSGSGVQEPMSYQMENGRIRTFSRTDLGCQYECYSDDDGMTWTDPMPNRNFTSPCSPMMMKRVGKYTVALLNPIPRYHTAVYDVVDDRSPLIYMISRDDGLTFPFYEVIDNRGHVCYPDLFDGGDYFLVGYQQLDDGMIKKIYLDDAEIK